MSHDILVNKVSDKRARRAEHIEGKLEKKGRATARPRRRD